MALRYQEVVPWGRNFDEYTRMFALTEVELKQRILGCGDGPASFNFEGNLLGGKITSVDPIYHFSRAEIEQRFGETYELVLDQTRANQEKFVWEAIPSVDELGRLRMEAMQLFLADYENGKAQGRYLPGELPELPFPDDTFNLALSSHFLFLYTDNLTFDFHVAAIREMLRVAREVRIFPILDVNARESNYLAGILEIFQENEPEICRVNYEFQRGGNQMLRLCQP